MILGLFGGLYLAVEQIDPVQKFHVDGIFSRKLLEIVLAFLGVVLSGLAFSTILETGARGILQGFPKIFRRPSSKHRDTKEESTPAISIQTSEIIAELRDSIHQETTREILKELRADLLHHDVVNEARTHSASTLERLAKERSKTAIRGNFNLFVGLLITFAGVWMLWSFAEEQASLLRSAQAQAAQERKIAQSALAASPRTNPDVPLPHGRLDIDLREYAVFFVPRLSLVILVEIFAYFFLGLYKLSLIEVKYIQNEATNIERQSIAVTTALMLNDNKTIATVLTSLAATDRNQSPSGPRAQTGTSDERAKLLEIVKELVKTSK